MLDRLPVLLHAAWLYYEDGLTQAEIADQLFVSRATVGRLLDDARRSGVVTFQFRSDQLEGLSLSREIRDTFSLNGALVIPDRAGSVDHETINERVARGAAQYLASRLRSGTVMALGWGDTVSRTLGALQHAFTGELTLVTMTGGANVYVQSILGDQEAERSGSMRVRAGVLPAPLLASTPELANALNAEEEVQRLLSECAAAPFALVGVGTPAIDSTIVQVGYVDNDELAKIVELGAVGDVLGQFFDDRGAVVDLPIHRRRIGIDISDLSARSNVVGVAGGEHKVRAILAAVYGGYIDVLVTDETTARAMLDSHARTQPEVSGATA